MKRWLFFSSLAHVGLFALIVAMAVALRPSLPTHFLSVRLVSPPPVPERRPAPKKEPEPAPAPRREVRKPERAPSKSKIPAMVKEKPLPRPVVEAPKKISPPEAPPSSELARPAERALPPGPSIEVAVQDPNFKFPYYYAMLQRKLFSTWDPPPLRYGNPVIDAVIFFSLGRDGSLKSPPRIEQSSGNAYYDQAALRAVLRAAPFPPFPEGYYENFLDVHYRFRYTAEG